MEETEEVVTYIRFTKADKRLIARAQKQEVYEDERDTVRLAGYRCKTCRREFTSRDDLEVDHIYPRSRGGVDGPRNLRLLCPRCNRKKGATLKGKTSTVKRKSSTPKKRSSTVKKKSSTAKKENSAAKRRTGTAKRKSSRVQRKRR